jgi:hypothetical protein
MNHYQAISTAKLQNYKRDPHNKQAIRTQNTVAASSQFRDQGLFLKITCITLSHHDRVKTFNNKRLLLPLVR